MNPFVVIAGVPIRIPEALNGFSVSKGIAFLLAVILISSSKRCAFLPEIPQLALTSTSNKWLSVPPATNLNPSSLKTFSIALAFLIICFA